jgi:hypothetical protein
MNVNMDWVADGLHSAIIKAVKPIGDVPAGPRRQRLPR